MATVLTNAELDTLCKSIVTAAQAYNVHMYMGMDTLYKTGCRVGELQTIARWLLTGSGSVGIITLKSNYIRVVDSGYVNSLLYERLSTGNTTEFAVSPLMLQRFIRDNLGYTKVMNGSKDCVAHLFRHNRCRTLSDAGWNINAIGTFMGQMSASTVYNYINDDLTAY